MPDGPRLPGAAPDALKRFVACTADRMELDLGDMSWIPKPDGVPDILTPSAQVVEGSTSTSATIRVGYGDFISIELPASIVDGQLAVDAADVGFGIGPEVQKWVDAFNRQLRENDKQLESFETRGDKVTMTKREIPAGAGTEGAAVAPATSAVPGGTRPPAEELDDEPAEDKKKPGCFAWLAGAVAAIAVALGLTYAATRDGGGDDAITTDSVPAADTTTTSTTAPPAPTTTLAEVGQAPPPSDATPQQAVCGNVDPAGSPIGPFDPELGPGDGAERARQVVDRSSFLDEFAPCTPSADGFGDCDPTFLPCSDSSNLFLAAYGQPGIDHTRSVPDAITGQEGASTAEQLVAMYAITGDVRYLVRLTSDCGGNLLTGDAPLVPNGATIVDNPLLNFGSCTIVDADLIPQGDPADEAFGEGLVRALRAAAVGQEYEVGPPEPDPALPAGIDSLTVAGPDVIIPSNWADPAVTLGNTFAGGPAADDCLWFFSPDNTELIVKALDACGGVDDHFWVFYGATTNVDVELTVSDTQVGTAAHFTNPLGLTAPPVQDTAAFATTEPYFGNTIFPCGYGHVAYTACPDGQPAMDAGGLVMVTSAMLGPIPIEGDGAERAHTVDFGPAGGPAYDITQSADGWSVSSSAGATRARALFRDNAVMLVAPQDELPAGALAYAWRTTVDGATIEQPVLPVDGLITTPAFPAAEPPADEPPVTEPVVTDPSTTDPPPPGTDPPDAGAPTETLDEFYSQLSASVSSGDLGFSLERLHPTVFEAYPTECPAALESFADPELTIAFVSEGESGPWTWEVPDGPSFEIPDAISVTIVLTGRGQAGVESEAHVAIVDNRYHWFTFCT